MSRSRWPSRSLPRGTRRTRRRGSRKARRLRSWMRRRKACPSYARVLLPVTRSSRHGVSTKADKPLTDWLHGLFGRAARQATGLRGRHPCVDEPLRIPALRRTDRPQLSLQVFPQGSVPSSRPSRTSSPSDSQAPSSKCRCSSRTCSTSFAPRSSSALRALLKGLLSTACGSVLQAKGRSSRRQSTRVRESGKAL